MGANLITVPLDPGLRTDPDNYSLKMDIFNTALAGAWKDQVNGLATQVNADAVAATAAAETAIAKAAGAAASAELATTNGAEQVALAAESAELATINGAEQVALAADQVGLAAGQVALATDQKDKSRQWSEENQNVEVEPGEFSAKHHSLRAKSYADNLLLDPIFSNSITSLTLALGAQSLTTDTGKNYVANMWIVLIDKADPETWMVGFVTNYVSGTGALDISITDFSGTGVVADWPVTQTNPGGGSSGGGGISATSLYMVQSF